MHPPLAHGFPGLVRKKADWSDWVVSPVWIVTEPVAKKDSNRRVGCVPNLLSISPYFHTTRDLDVLLCPVRPLPPFPESRLCPHAVQAARKPKFASPPNDDTHQKSRLSRKQRRWRVSYCGKASDFRYDSKLLSSRTYRRGLLQIWLVPGE